MPIELLYATDPTYKGNQETPLTVVVTEIYRTFSTISFHLEPSKLIDPKKPEEKVEISGNFIDLCLDRFVELGFHRIVSPAVGSRELVQTSDKKGGGGLDR